LKVGEQKKDLQLGRKVGLGELFFFGLFFYLKSIDFDSLFLDSLFKLEEPKTDSQKIITLLSQVPLNLLVQEAS
jgi:hypothetical protein